MCHNAHLSTVEQGPSSVKAAGAQSLASESALAKRKQLSEVCRFHGGNHVIYHITACDTVRCCGSVPTF